MKSQQIVIWMILLGAVMARGMAEDRSIRIEMVVEAAVEQVWDAWTTEAGVRSFFAPECHIESHVDGLYEIFFVPDAPEGQRGAEGMRILVWEPPVFFSFTWNAPPQLQKIRGQRTHVMIRLYPLDTQRTRLVFIHDGWGEGEEWDKAFNYFEQAWKKVVLPRMQYRFRAGPIDWQHPPELP